MAPATTAGLTSEHGISEAKVSQLKAAFEPGPRLLVTSPAERPHVRSPVDAAQLLTAEMSLLEHEH